MGWRRPTRSSNPALHEGKTQSPAEWTSEGLLWGLPTSVALFSTLSEEQMDEQRPNLWEICRETKSVQCTLLSGFLQYMYWANSDSLLVILCWYRLWPNITSSSSRCHGGRCCPAKVSLIAQQPVAAAPIVLLVDRFVWNLGQNQYSS